MKVGDKLVLGLLLTIFLASGLYITWLNNTRGDQLLATVLSDGAVIREIDLSAVPEPYQFRVEDGRGGYNIVSVEPGRIRVIEANCPEQVDVRQGWISQPHQSIVCLPNRLVIRLSTKGPSDVDFIVR
jgi:hypothetical protein